MSLVKGVRTMEGYFSKNPYGVAEKNAKGRLKIEAVNLSEFKHDYSPTKKIWSVYHNNKKKSR